jgi:hypothetical protein
MVDDAPSSFVVRSCRFFSWIISVSCIPTNPRYNKSKLIQASAVSSPSSVILLSSSYSVVLSLFYFSSMPTSKGWVQCSIGVHPLIQDECHNLAVPPRPTDTTVKAWKRASVHLIVGVPRSYMNNISQMHFKL